MQNSAAKRRCFQSKPEHSLLLSDNAFLTFLSEANNLRAAASNMWDD